MFFCSLCCLSQQLKDIESRLQKPDTAAFERQLKTLENVSQKANTVTMDTASKIVGIWRLGSGIL